MDEGVFGAVGTTYRRAGQAGLAYFTLEDAAALHRACGFSESVYLATCNRVEMFFWTRGPRAVARARERFYGYFAGQRGPAPAPFVHARALSAFADEGALERLFVVAAALDSMVPGEAQVLGQLKAAHAAACAQGLCGARLTACLEEAYGVAKRVRARTALGRGRVSMMTLATGLLQDLGRAAPRPTWVVVGAGDMARQCARQCAQRARAQGARLLFVNRSLAPAQALAREFGGALAAAQRDGAQALSLANFLASPPPFAALITCTASPQPIFDAAFLARLPKDALLIDLSVTRDVCLRSAQALGLRLWDIDKLETRAKQHDAARREAVALGRALVDEALERWRLGQHKRQLGQALAAWRRQAEQDLLRALGSLTAPGATGAEATSAAAGQALVGRWLHAPTQGLRALAEKHGLEAVATFVEGARLPLEGRGDAPPSSATRSTRSPT